jgi:mRNA interferase MazF
MPKPAPREVWLVDLGMSAKVRPCLVRSDYPADDELALIVVIPHTTATRGNRWEHNCPKSFLRAGVFHLQQVQPVSVPRLERRLGELTREEYQSLAEKLAKLLNLFSREAPSS